MTPPYTKTVSAPTAEEFIKKINPLLEDGWVPVIDSTWRGQPKWMNNVWIILLKKDIEQKI